MDPFILAAMNSNGFLLKSELLKQQVLYLDACEILQIDPIVMHNESHVLKRLELAREHYNSIYYELVIVKLRRREMKKSLVRENGFFKGRRLFKELMSDYKEEFSYIDEARKSVMKAEVFFVYMEKLEFHKFFVKFIAAVNKKQFVPHPKTISNVWKSKDTFSDLNINSTAFVSKKSKR